MKFNKTFLTLFLIIFFGLILRIYNMDKNSLYGDELTIVQDAYSILKTGRDSLGNFMPLTFPMGAGRPAGYVYGSVPFVAIFGPTDLGVRSLSLLSGLGIILLLYFLGKRLFSQKMGIVAAGIAAVSPWDISLSRGGFEAHFALFLALLGFYLFLKAKEKPILYIFSALSFGLTLHTYPTYKVSLLLFLPLLFWFAGMAAKKYFAAGITVFIILAVLALAQTFTGGSEERFRDVNIFAQSNLKNSIEQKVNLERSISFLPPSISKYFHNKPVEYAKVFLENYFDNFSLDFLVIHGDGNPRHNMATMGGIYFVQLILIFAGFVAFWTKYKRVLIFLLLWLLLAPLPTAFLDVPHALRSSFMLPPLIMMSTLGLTSISEKKNKLLLAGLAIIFVIQFIFFIQKLYFLAPTEYSRFWSYPARKASDVAIKEKDNFDYVILSDQIDNLEFAYPVYAKIDPKIVISQNRKKSSLGKYQLKQFDNVYIGYIPEGERQDFIDSLEGQVLYIGRDDVNP